MNHISGNQFVRYAVKHTPASPRFRHGIRIRNSRFRSRRSRDLRANRGYPPSRTARIAPPWRRSPFQAISKSYGGAPVIENLDLSSPRPGIHGPRRPLRLRKVDRPAHARRPRGDPSPEDRDRRSGGQRRAAQGPRHRDGLPELRALSPHDDPREPRVRPSGCAGFRPAREIGSSARPPRCWASPSAARPPPRAALGRPAPARRARARDRPQAGGLPVRRAAVQPRREAARADARGDQEAAEPSEDDHRVRDARPGRGDDDGDAASRS